MKARILLVEDDANLAFLIEDALRAEGYEVQSVGDGEKALTEFRLFQPELCLLDVMLPAKDGFELAFEIRKQNQQVPILFLTARSLKEDRIRGFQMGGDDYILKPFSMEELKLRVAVFLKRSRTSGADTGKELFQQGNLIFDPENLSLTLSGTSIRLTQKESDLLLLLWRKKNTLVKREEILLSLWGDDDYFMGRSLDVFISRLRKCLKPEPGLSIENTHKVGFTLRCS